VPAIEISERPFEGSGLPPVIITKAPDSSLNASGSSRGPVPDHRAATPIQTNSIPPATAQENAASPDTANENSAPVDSTPENALPTGAASHNNQSLAEEAVKRFKVSPKTKDAYVILEKFINSAENHEAVARTEQNMTPQELLNRLKGMQKVMSNEGDSEAEKRAWDNVKETIGNWTDKVVNVLQQVVPIGDVVAGFDPVHAALPWAAMKAVLTVSKSLRHSLKLNI
jgi:hypothetical protein